MLCRVCDATEIDLILDLGVQPWGNGFLKKEQIEQEKKYPLQLVRCKQCETVQLNYTVPKETMFSDHTYVSGTTSTLRQHFVDTAKYIDDRFLRDTLEKNVFDIGSNDGTQLEEYKKLGYNVLGVESCKRISDIANENGIPTLNTFFNEDVAKTIQNKFHVINASGVFFHLEDLHPVTKGVKHLLAENGVFVVQFLYMKSIVENNAFDQIYHEHLLYYTLKTIEILLNRHGLASFDAYLSSIHGGSIILLVTHKDKAVPSERLKEMRKSEEFSGANSLEWYLNFSHRVKKVKQNVRNFLEKQKSLGKKIFGMGAPVKGNTLLNYCEVDVSLIECLVERNPMRINLFSPGMHIPIILEDEITVQPDIYFVLAWNFKKEILSRYARLIDNGIEFYFPVEVKE